MLEAVAASPSLARHLVVPRRFPLVYVESVTRDAAAKPIDCYRSWMRTDRLRIAVETSAHPVHVDRYLGLFVQAVGRRLKLKRSPHPLAELAGGEVMLFQKTPELRFPFVRGSTVL